MNSRRKEDAETADLHTPEELLAGAESLLLSPDPQMRRAAVLEALTALEAFVHSRVFGVLAEKLDPLLLKWLRQKTRMDFDSRLGVLTPVALGRPVDKRSVLWSNYKRAKRIRNEASHLGRKVSSNEARFVVQTVYDWLAFLGSTVEVELALAGLKKHIERTGVKIERVADATEIILRYFAQTKAASGTPEARLPGGRRADLVLRFGDHTVLVETKLTRGGPVQFKSRLTSAVAQTLQALEIAGLSRAAIVIFHEGELPESLQVVRTLEEGKISVVGIHI